MRRLISFLLLAAVAGSCAGIAAPAWAALPDSAKLTPSGLGGISVGMTESAVERVLGRGISLDNNAGGGSCATARLPHRSYALFTDGRLRSVSLSSPFYATKSGLRVGMPQRAVLEQYGQKAKRSRHAYTPGGYYFKVTRGNRRLVFETDGDKITTIHGGRRPEVDYIEGCA